MSSTISPTPTAYWSYTTRTGEVRIRAPWRWRYRDGTGCRGWKIVELVEFAIPAGGVSALRADAGGSDPGSAGCGRIYALQSILGSVSGCWFWQDHNHVDDAA